MVSSVIYTKTLLPEILEFCQSFFPSLIEYSYHMCEPNTTPKLEDIDDVSKKLLKELKKSLSIDALKAALQKPVEYLKIVDTQEIEDLVLKFNHHLSIATHVRTTSTSNPLAPIPLLDNIFTLLQDKFGLLAIDFYKNIQQQFLLLAAGFYRKLNSLVIQYILSINKNRQPRKTNPYNNTDLFLNNDSLLFSQEVAEHSLQEAQTAIEQAQSFFEHELSAQVIGAEFNKLCKVIYIPVVHYTLSNLKTFDTNSKDEFKQLLLQIQIIGTFYKELQKQKHGREIITNTKNIIQDFSKKALKGELVLTNTLKDLKLLAAQCQKVTYGEDINLANKLILKPAPKDDLNSHLFKEGMWFDYAVGDGIVRCKLAAIIKPIKRYVFVSLEGEKILDINDDELQNKLINNQLLACDKIMLDSCLEEVMCHLKNHR